LIVENNTTQKNKLNQMKNNYINIINICYNINDSF